MLYDFLVIRQLVPVNPTTSVRGPKYVIKRGKTPVWSREDAKKLLENEYLARVSIEDKQSRFQSVNKAGTALTGRALNQYNAWSAIRKRARNAGFLTPV